jgi:dipeptidyl aminopeptidase/acylaminoacyl peptidase
MINLERLLRVPCVEAEHSFDISPDGATAAFSWNLTGQWEIYTCPIAGSADPHPFLPGPGSRFNPKFSPVNPQQLICAVDFDGSERFHLLLLDLSSGKSADLTPDDALMPRFAWSPDGAQVAFISNRSGCFDVHILDLNTRKEHLTCTVGHPAWDVSWSPDGHRLAVNAETNGQDNGIYLLKSNNHNRWKIESWDIFNSRLNAKNPSWSPDGKKLAFCATHDEFYQIGIFDVASGQITWLTDGAGDKTSPIWDAKGGRLVYVCSSGATSRLVIQTVCVDCSDPRLPSPAYYVAPGLHRSPQFSPDGQNLVCIFENPQNPPALWLLSPETGLFRSLTTPLPAEINKNDLPMPVEILYPGFDEGIQVPALLYQPEKTHAPTVVNIHGGPNWHFSMDWNPFMSYLASRGWVVLAPNYRGSTGYGHHWQMANYKDLGGCDTRDVASGVQHLINEGLADSKHVVVTGRSHGGYLTMTCLTQYPELWAAGSGVVPFFNMFTSHYASREDLQHWNIENMGDPLENEALWRERSPYFSLDRVNAPVQIICGGLDPRCPAVDSVDARDKLLSLGKSVDFLLYPDEGHIFLKMENVLEAETRRAEFLARYLE